MTATICPRCGAVAPARGDACGRCGAEVGARPPGPPVTPRCPVCGTADVVGRRTCPGCGLALRSPDDRLPPDRPSRRSTPWWLACAALVLVGVTASVVLLLTRDGRPPLVDRWRVDLGGLPVGGVAVSGEVVLTATADGVVTAVDAPSGIPRWRFLSEQPPSAPLAAGAGVVVLATTAPTGGGLVFAVDLRTGQERWRVLTPEVVTEAAAIDDQGVHLAQGDVTSHDTATGEERWRRDVGGAGGLASGDGTLVVAAGDGVVALDAGNGELRWSSGGGRPAAGPGVVGDLVVVGDGPGGVVARALERGQERWRADGLGTLLQPALAGPGVVVAVTDGGVVALDATDGEVRWEAGPSGDERLRGATDGTSVAVATGAGTLLVDGSTGDVVASARRPDPADGEGVPRPGLVGGSVLVTDDRELVALRPRRG